MAGNDVIALRLARRWLVLSDDYYRIVVGRRFDSIFFFENSSVTVIVGVPFFVFKRGDGQKKKEIE